LSYGVCFEEAKIIKRVDLKKFCLALFAIKTANARHLKALLLFEIIIELLS